MLASGERCYFSLLLCSFPCVGIHSGVKGESVIAVVIVLSLAPSATSALKRALCVRGHSHSSLSLLPFVSVKCYMLFPIQTGGNCDAEQPARAPSGARLLPALRSQIQENTRHISISRDAGGRPSASGRATQKQLCRARSGESGGGGRTHV